MNCTKNTGKSCEGLQQNLVRMDVVGIGALNYDRLFLIDTLARRGTHQSIKGICEAAGGSAANTVCDLANLGFKAGFLGAVGKDPEGGQMLNEFKSFGVDHSKVKSIKGRTGMIVCFVEKTGERTMYVHPGVNSRLTLSREDVKYANRAKLIHLSSFVSTRQLNEQKKILTQEKKISFSPGFLYSKLGLKRLKPILARAKVVFLNNDEIRLLTRRDYRKGSLILLNQGADIVVVTLDKRGCFVTDGSISKKIPAYKTKVVDTTGAGDAFCAGFLAALMEEKSLQDCGKLGNKLASKCIKKFGARL